MPFQLQFKILKTSWSCHVSGLLKPRSRRFTTRLILRDQIGDSEIQLVLFAYALTYDFRADTGLPGRSKGGYIFI